MKTIQDVDVQDKRVLVRVDFNVPLDEQQNITDDNRIRAALPTLSHAVSNGAKLMVMSHLGRPKGKVVPEFSLKPAAARLGELLGVPVTMAPDCVGPETASLAEKMKSGEVMMLENLRYHAEEQENDDAFAQSLADLCDIYVNDAFAVSHRAHASVEAVTKFAPVSVSGLLVKKELDYFQKSMSHPKRPLVAVIGGAKVSSKLKALENMLGHVDKVIIGGAMANTFLKQMGFNMGASKLEEDMLEAAANLMKRAAEEKIKFYLPVDVVAGDRFAPDAVIRKAPVQEVPEGWMALDIGPATSLLYAEALYDAKTIVWNGPMGAFEMDAFSRGTTALADCIADSHALSIIGGGDTGAAVQMAGQTGRMSYISTGGGAFLGLMEGKKLPALAALEAAQKE